MKEKSLRVIVHLPLVTQGLVEFLHEAGAARLNPRQDLARTVGRRVVFPHLVRLPEARVPGAESAAVAAADGAQQQTNRQHQAL